MRHAPLFAVLIAASGCVTLRPNGAWRELTTEHFRLATNVDAAAARREAVRLETTLASLAALTAPDRPLPTRVDVLWLADELQIELLGVSEATGYYLPHQYGEPTSPPLIVAGGRPGAALDGRFTHELTHLLLVDALPNAPAWVTEGLAGWYATLDVDRGTLGFDANEAGYRAMYPIDRLRTVSLAKVLGSDENAYHHFAFGSLFYRGALNFVGMLQTRPDWHERFVDYLARLGRGERQPVAWIKTLGALWRDDLERDYERFALATPTPAKITIWAGTPSLASLTPPVVERWFARARPWDSREALVAAGAALKRAAADDSAERHYWSGVYAARWRRWREADGELRAALARDPAFAPAAAALAAVTPHLAAPASATR